MIVNKLLFNLKQISLLWIAFGVALFWFVLRSCHYDVKDRFSSAFKSQELNELSRELKSQ